jgi:PAS domain S-box-containing protein
MKFILEKKLPKIKQLENKLAESEERLSVFAALYNDVLWEWDIANGNHKWIGDIDTYLGYKNNEFPRTIEAWKNIIHQDDRERITKKLREHHEKHVRWHEQYRVIKKNGEVRWWDDRGQTQWDEDDNPIIMRGVILDITERKLQEKNFFELEKKNEMENMQGNFLSMLDQLPVCFHLQGSDYNVPYANKMFRDRFGDPLGAKCYELMHNREKSCEPCPTFEVFDSLKTKTNLWTSPDKKVYLTVTTPFLGIDGKSQLMEMSLDITKETAAEELLALSEKKFEILFKESPLGVALIDSITGHIYEANTKYAEITGRSLEEISCIDWMSMTHPDDLETDLNNMAALNAGKIKSFKMEKRLIKPDGSYLWIDMTVSPLIVFDKSFPRHLAMIEDITDKKKNEESLTRFGRVLTSSSNEIYMFNSKTLKFSQVNIGACKNLGYSAEEMDQLTPLDLKPSFDLKIFEELVKPLRERKESTVNFETVHKRKDGSVYPINVNLQLIHEESPPLFVAIVEDITIRTNNEYELKKYQNHLEEEINKRTLELKSSQDQLIHSEKLSSLGKFAGTVAHEFNNPLFGVINLIEQMGEDLSRIERKTFSELAQKECWRMAGMIKSLQSFYKPSDETFMSINMVTLIDEVLLVVGKLCRNKRIIIHKKYGVCDPSFEGIEDQIKQVLLNVFQNAIDSISDGGEITLSLASVSKEIILEIQDTGSGIEKENQKYIFDPFYTTKGKEGTGLGLSVSYGIIKKHGGYIKIDSEPNIGSTITLVFPKRRKL